MKRGKLLIRIFSILLIVGLLISSFIIFKEDYLTGLTIKEKIDGLGIFGPIILIGALIIQGIFSIFPSAIFVIFAGNNYGVIQGSIYSLIGLGMGAIISFFIGRGMGKDVEKAWFSRKKINDFDKLFKKHGAYISCFGRMLFIFPANIISFASGTTKMSFRKYFIATIIGLIPFVLLMTFVGTKISLLISNIKNIIIVLIIVIIILIFRKYNHKIIKYLEKIT